MLNLNFNSNNPSSDTQIIIFVSGMRDLYKRHIYNVLAYPPGAMMDLTYSIRWIQQEIWNNVNNYKNVDALIVGICTNGPHGDIFIPIRKVKILNLETDGSLLHIKFLLTEYWVEFLNDNYENGNQTFIFRDREYHKLISELEDIPIRNPGQTHSSGLFVQIQDISQFEYSSEIRAWEHIIHKIGKLEEYQRGIFFRFIGTRDSSNKEINIKKFDDNTYGYELTEGRSYLAKISFNFGKEPPYHAENSLFQIFGSELRTVPERRFLEFRVYRNDFVVSTPESPNNIRTLLFMNILNTNTRDFIEGPFLEIPIKLKMSSWRYLSYILIIIGIVITILSSFIAQLIYPTTDPIYPTTEFFIRLSGSFLTIFGITFMKK